MGGHSSLLWLSQGVLRAFGEDSASLTAPHPSFNKAEMIWTILASWRGGASQMALVVKEAACQCRRHETWVWSLGWKDPLEDSMTTHSSILAWRIPVDRGAWWATVYKVAKSQTWLKQLSALQSPELRPSLHKAEGPIEIWGAPPSFLQICLSKKYSNLMVSSEGWD